MRIAVVAIAAFLIAAAPAAAVEIKGFGSYSFSRLGSPDLTMRGKATAHGRTIAFTLPAGSAERPGHWYVLHLHARVEIAPDSPPGRAYLEAVSANGFGSAKILFSVKGRGDPIEWHTVGALGGSDHRSASRQIELRFANVMPYSGVRVGANALTFAVEEYGARVSAVTIFADSAIELTRLGPAQITVHATTNRQVVAVGEHVVATVEVANAGDRPVRAITVQAMVGGPQVVLDGAASRSRGSLAPGKKLFESFSFTGAKTGSIPIVFFVSSSANRPATQIEVTTRGAAAAAPSTADTPRASGARTRFAVVGGVVAGLLLLILAAAVLRRRSRTDP